MSMAGQRRQPLVSCTGLILKKVASYPEASLDWLHALPEQVHAELLKTRPRDGGVEVCTLKQGIDLNAGLSCAGKRALGSLTCCQQPPDCSGVIADIFLMLALEFLHFQKVKLHQKTAVVHILSLFLLIPDV